MSASENLNEVSEEQREKDIPKKSLGKYLFWTILFILAIVWIDSITNNAIGIISAFTNPEHTWYENIINEFHPSPDSDKEWVDAIKHGFAFPVNFIINLFIDHPYKVETEETLYNTLFWSVAGLELIIVIRKWLFNNEN